MVEVLGLAGVIVSMALAAWGATFRKSQIKKSLARMEGATDSAKEEILETLRPAAGHVRVRTAMQEAVKDASPPVQQKASEVMQEAPADDYSKPLLSVLPKWLVVTLFVICFCLMFVIAYLSIFRYQLFVVPMARIGLILITSLALSIVFVVLYPSKIETPIPGLATVARVTGLFGAFVLVWSFLDARLPPCTTDRFYSAYEQDEHPNQYLQLADVSNLKLEFSPETMNLVHPVVGPNGKDVIGLVVQFPAASGSESIEGRFTLPYRDPTTIRLSRFGGDDFFRVNPPKKP